MIPIQLILNLSLYFILSLPKYWKNIAAWIRNAYKQIKEGGVLYFVKNTWNNLHQQIVKKYQKKTDTLWEETIIERTISSNEVPPEILSKVENSKNVEVNMTHDMEKALCLSA